jgi:hypothetical protein
MDGLLYGLGWALELLAASGVLWAVQGSRPVAPLLAVINLSLGILFWIGPEKLLLEGPLALRDKVFGGAAPATGQGPELLADGAFDLCRVGLAGIPCPVE